MLNRKAFGQTGIGIAFVIATGSQAAMGQGWHQADPQGGVSPPARIWHAGAYHDASGKFVIFGGWDNSRRVPRNDTWLWDGTRWEEGTGLAPTARYTHSMVYDSGRQVIVLFGRYNGVSDDVWEWEWDTGLSVGIWSNVSPPSGPGGRESCAMAYDAARGVTVMYGGFKPGTATYSDTWTWDGNRWVLMDGASPPGPRRAHAMAYDAERQEVVLFGGSGSHDTWVWNGAKWQVRASDGPPARTFHSMAYDSDRARVVLFGGFSRLDRPLNDTWEWDGTGWAKTGCAAPSVRFAAAMAYDLDGRRVVLFGGGPSSTEYDDQTWEYGLCDDPCDMNCDGGVDARDIEPFLGLLFDGAAPCGICTGDVNCDGAIDANDIEPFLECLFP